MGIISELNILPFMDNIWMKKFMWYHCLLNSGDERQAKMILLEQIQDDENWYTELKEYAEKCGINIEVDWVQRISYKQYKDMVKKGIEAKVVTQLNDEKTTKTKLRWINPGKRQSYVTSCSI